MIHLAIIKSVRACNLRCPYCYYINNETKNYGQMISEQTIERLYFHVSQHLAAQQGFGFVWHGGEPLLMGRRRFKRFLDMQKNFFSPDQIRNLLQTNGVLIDQPWIDFFNENGVAVGLSLDGPQELHDRNRPKVSGKGSYQDVVKAIELLHKNKMMVCVLSVVDGRRDGYEALAHLQGLGVHQCDFLIPMTNNALQGNSNVGIYHQFTDFQGISNFLLGAFQRWIETPEPKIGVRLFECLMQNAFGISHGYLNAGSCNLSESLVLETNGDICLDTDFSHIDRYQLGSQYNLQLNVHNKDFSLSDVEQRLKNFIASERLDLLPEDCQTCKVRSICHASHPASRFDADGSYNHRSAYCEAFYALGEIIVDYLHQKGLSSDFYDPDLKAVLLQESCHRPHDTVAVRAV